MQDFFLSILFENNKLEWLTHIMTSPDTCNILIDNQILIFKDWVFNATFEDGGGGG